MRRAAALALLLPALACGDPSVPPNLVWIVWDTVRADRLGLYGNERDTTPHLDRWARRARVFDCTAASAWTVPSHASMFTGLFPGQHGSWSPRSRLSARFVTVAELLRDAGYQTWLWSANPFVSGPYGVTRGFEGEEHPFDAALAPRALELMREKVDPRDRSTKLARKLAAPGGDPSKWTLLSVGPLANERFAHFLDARDPARPFFAFLNYMEAHRMRVPARSRRAALMDAEQVEASYRIDLDQARFQRISLGLAEPFGPGEQRVVEGLYDASILELDALLDALLADLRARGLLEHTVVVLVSDHGEHLGEKGSYLHQYSLYEGVTRVPLVVWAPGRLTPGFEPVPVMNLDVFPTLLELAGLSPPGPPGAVSLLAPRSDRLLVSEYLEPYEPLLSRFERRHPEWDSSRFRQRLRAARRGSLKYLWRSGGAAELYDLAADPGERRDLLAEAPERAAELAGELERFVAAHPPAAPEAERELSGEEEEGLRALGYLPDEEAEGDAP